MSKKRLKKVRALKQKRAKREQRKKNRASFFSSSSSSLSLSNLSLPFSSLLPYLVGVLAVERGVARLLGAHVGHLGPVEDGRGRRDEREEQHRREGKGAGGGAHLVDFFVFEVEKAQLT